MPLKRALFIYLSFSMFWLSGHKDAVHHFIHGWDSHQEVSASTSSSAFEIKPESHEACWIEDFLQHRSNQTHLALDFVTFDTPTVSSQAHFDHDPFILKDSQRFSKLARGPPAISLT
jgi:hypothetical protein